MHSCALLNIKFGSEFVKRFSENFLAARHSPMGHDRCRFFADTSGDSGSLCGSAFLMPVSFYGVIAATDVTSTSIESFAFVMDVAVGEWWRGFFPIFPREILEVRNHNDPFRKESLAL